MIVCLEISKSTTKYERTKQKSGDCFQSAVQSCCFFKSIKSRTAKTSAIESKIFFLLRDKLKITNKLFDCTQKVMFGLINVTDTLYVHVQCKRQTETVRERQKMTCNVSYIGNFMVYLSRVTLVACQLNKLCVSH